jgi:alkylation response protein AidB-like acyl-CoA dehydrogenase
MDFHLSEEQKSFQRAVKRFTEREIEPIAARIDEGERLPDGLIRKMADAGLFGIALPRRYGGQEGSHLDAVLACEQIAYSGTGAWWLAAFHNSIPDSIAQFGSDKIKEKYLPPICSGSAYASIQFTEEGTGSNPKALRTTAALVDGSYVVNGTKRFSTFGEREGCAVLYAKDATGRCSAFVIEKNRKGYQTTKKWKLMGGGGIEAVDVLFENMKVPEENLLGEQGKGFDVLSHWIASEKIEQCSACVGMAQAALDEAVNYARCRTVREKPMADMQGIQWMLAEMYAKIGAARWLTYRTAFLQDQKASSWMTEAAAAKLFVMPAVLEIVELGRRIHGAYGYSREFKIERICRAIVGATGIATSLEINKSLVGGWLLK